MFRDLDQEWRRQADILADSFAATIGFPREEYLAQLPKFDTQPPEYQNRFDIPLIIQTPTGKLTLRKIVELAKVDGYPIFRCSLNLTPEESTRELEKRIEEWRDLTLRLRSREDREEFWEKLGSLEKRNMTRAVIASLKARIAEQPDRSRYIVQDWISDPYRFKTPTQPYVAWVNARPINEGEGSEVIRANLGADERGGTMLEGITLIMMKSKIIKTTAVGSDRPDNKIILPGSEYRGGEVITINNHNGFRYITADRTSIRGSVVTAGRQIFPPS